MDTVSVTRVLQPFNNFSHIPPDVLKNACERGNRVHAAIAAHLSGTFQVVTLPEDERPLLESLIRWCDEMVETVIAIEPEVIHQDHGYIGHPDAILVLKSGEKVVVDWKTPQVESRSWPIQIAAYCWALEIGNGMAVQPHPEGKMARGIRYDFDPKHWQVFLSALICYRWFNQK